MAWNNSRSSGHCPSSAMSRWCFRLSKGLGVTRGPMRAQFELPDQVMCTSVRHLLSLLQHIQFAVLPPFVLHPQLGRLVDLSTSTKTKMCFVDCSGGFCTRAGSQTSALWIRAFHPNMFGKCIEGSLVEIVSGHVVSLYCGNLNSRPFK